jgi:hypothetical protein
VRPTRQIWEAEETPFYVMLIFRHGRRGYELTHKSSRRSSIRLHQSSFFVRAICVPQGAMNNIQGVAKFIEVDLVSLRVGNLQLNDWRRVNHSSISLAESARSGSYRLLSNFELIP